MEASNLYLRKLFEEDQMYRYGQGLAVELTEEMEQQRRMEDGERVGAILKMYEAGVLKTAGDFWRASVILQHSEELEHYRVANELAAEGVRLEQPPMLSLLARTCDRLVVCEQRLMGLSDEEIVQPFGTQFKTDKKRRIIFVYAIGSEIEIVDKGWLGVMPLDLFLGKTVTEYYEERELFAKERLNAWGKLADVERLILAERLIAISSINASLP